MLSEWMVEALLVGGVAGAGLVLTTLTLAVMKSEELLTERAKRGKKAKTEIQSESKKPVMDTKKIIESANKHTTLNFLPDYLSGLVLFSFLSFGASSFLALLWFLVVNSSRPWIEILLEIAFGLSILTFLIMGRGMKTDLEAYMKQKYEKIKREEDKAASKSA